MHFTCVRTLLATPAHAAERPGGTFSAGLPAAAIGTLLPAMNHYLPCVFVARGLCAATATVRTFSMRRLPRIHAVQHHFCVTLYATCVCCFLYH